MICLAALALIAAAGCAPRESGERAADDGAARNQALIAAANQAYRSGQFELAAKRYAAAAVARKEDPAAYFGLGMALTKLGRLDEARTAYARSRELARQRKPRRRRRTLRDARAACPRPPG